MGVLLIFPRERVVRASPRSSRIDQLEHRILELLRLLRHRHSPDAVEEILRLRDEIWRLEADEASDASSPFPH